MPVGAGDAKQIQVLNVQSWPADVTTPWREGEERLKRLCERLGVDVSKARRGFRDFMDAGGSSMPEDLDELKLAIETLPVTSADAERGFSTMHILCNPLRNRLGVQRLSSLIFVSLVGPALSTFKPLPYVKQWLVSGHRGAYDNQSRKREIRETFRYDHMNQLFC